MNIPKTFVLENKNGIRAELTNVGASLMKLTVNGINTVLGYDCPEDYLKEGPPYGATVGRFANRIGGAAFKLGDCVYKVDKNEGENCLHGGFDKWYRRIWDAEQTDSSSVTFSLVSPDGDQGMPGRADVFVTYTLSDDNALSIKYMAVSDKDTYFNLTNHSYFNLGGEIPDHTLWMNCDKYAEIDAGLIPTGVLLPVDEHMSFLEAKALDTSYDHCYILAQNDSSKPFARVSCGSITMEVYTDLPAVQLFTGQGRSVCLETQFIPDTPNRPEFPSCLYKTGEPFRSETIYKFI